MPHAVNTFAKAERLCSKRLIDDLFLHGQRLMVYPYSINFRLYPLAIGQQQPSFPVQVLIIVSKRKFHHAVDRNRIKRLTRECYRLRKTLLYDALCQSGFSLTFSLRYVDGGIMDFHTLSHRMDKVVQALIDRVKTLSAMNPEEVVPKEPNT